MIKKRRPLEAAFYSLLTPGIGQLYTGRGKIAVWLFVLWAIVGAAIYRLLASELVLEFDGYLVGAALVLAAIALYLFAIVDAFRSARQQPDISPRWFMRWYIYVGVLVGGIIFNLLVDPGVRSIATYNIPAKSMLPGLQVGDHLVAETSAFVDRTPQRGEVVIYLEPGGADFIKRVIGLPGDKIQMVDGILHLNGRPVERREIGPITIEGLNQLPVQATRYLETLPGGASYEILEMSNSSLFDNTPPFTVPTGHFFALGDNRDNSLDSRAPTHGSIPLSDLKDKPQYLYWSKDLSRIGLQIDAD